MVDFLFIFFLVTYFILFLLGFFLLTIIEITTLLKSQWASDYAFFVNCFTSTFDYSKDYWTLKFLCIVYRCFRICWIWIDNLKIWKMGITRDCIKKSSWHWIYLLSSIIIQCNTLFHSVGEFMSFTNKILVERTATSSRASVKEQGRS